MQGDLLIPILFNKDKFKEEINMENKKETYQYIQKTYFL